MREKPGIGLYDDMDSWQWSLADRGFYRDAQRYILITELKTWREAQSYCREHHTDLASVRNQAENKEILQTAGGQDVLIGLFRGEPWEWSDQSSSSYRNWYTGEPDNAEGTENCAVVSAADAGRWKDLKCNEAKPFICYEDNLVLVRENKSWDEALSYCRQHYGDLVSVSTEQLQHWVKRRAQNASTAHVWLGLRYSCKMHFWFWLNGKILPLENEYDECGRRGAVESGGGQQWVSLPETEKLNFICSKCEGLCTLCSCLYHQYHFVNIEKSWTEAQSYCRENYIDLATIDNQEEMEALMGVVGSGYEGEAWIGLYDDRDSWQWSLADRGFYSEGQTEFRNWASVEPNNDGGKQHCWRSGTEVRSRGKGVEERRRRGEEERKGLGHMLSGGKGVEERRRRGEEEERLLLTAVGAQPVLSVVQSH
ncbi:hypothetical protein JZ751_021287 [Albula glossodonta]|uniref:C-type lectin domain-containing protein n=1 Tax=Albula glossodonta TaxID=121402 RepID=A0A8T2MZD0_9TELE|nr:hypothetical protein JZ751_021287 [Albula glossodonta]